MDILTPTLNQKIFESTASWHVSELNIPSWAEVGFWALIQICSYIDNNCHKPVPCHGRPLQDLLKVRGSHVGCDPYFSMLKWCYWLCVCFLVTIIMSVKKICLFEVWLWYSYCKIMWKYVFWSWNKAGHFYSMILCLEVIRSMKAPLSV